MPSTAEAANMPMGFMLPVMTNMLQIAREIRGRLVLDTIFLTGELCDSTKLQMSIHSASGSRSAQALSFLCAAFAVGSTAFGAPGDLDPTFVLPTFNGAVVTAVPQENGDVLVGGAFTNLNININTNIARYRAARLSSAGTVDGNYKPDLNNLVQSIYTEMGGSSFYTGAFGAAKITLVNPVNRLRIAKFDKNSALEAFNPVNTAPVVFSIREQSGLYVIGTSAGFSRLTSVGAKDTTFNDYTQGPVWNAQVLSDLKILINGEYPFASSEVDRLYFDRQTFTGEKDTNFNNPTLEAPVHCVTVLPNGNMLVGGEFPRALQTVGSTTTPYDRPYLMRISSSGIYDPNFVPVINGPVYCMAVQADGKILIGGGFTTVGGIARKGIARINANGSVDSTFDAKITSAGYAVQGIALQADGKILITGAFTQFNSSATPRTQLARLHNDTPINDLRALNDKTVRWRRGGSAPESNSVKFEYSTNSGSSWNPIGTSNPFRIADGWQVTTTTPLPTSCRLRAKAQVSAGLHGASVGVVAKTANYPSPTLFLTKNPSSTEILNLATVNVGPVTSTMSRNFTFTIQNTGTSNLTGLTPSVSGGDAARFTFQQSPVGPLAPGATTQFVVRFTPNGMGAKTTSLKITSNDPEYPNFTVTLTGTGATEIEDWRYQYFGVTTDTGNAAASADPDGDGQTNQFEFVAGLIPNDGTSRFEQRVDAGSGNTKIIFSPIVAGRTYEVLTNIDLGSTWTAATVGAPSDNGTERTLTETIAPDPKRFYRVKITKP